MVITFLLFHPELTEGRALINLSGLEADHARANLHAPGIAGGLRDSRKADHAGSNLHATAVIGRRDGLGGGGLDGLGHGCLREAILPSSTCAWCRDLDVKVI